jgi:integrase
MISAVPDFPKLARAKKTSASTPMKGRPITAEEFKRKLAKVESVVGINTAATTEKKTNELVLRNQEIVESWKFFLNGLWWSGLRLEEALGLRWDHSEDQLHVDFTGKHPMLRVFAECEKGHQDRLMPLAPEFAEFLSSVPDDERTGRVFDPQRQRRHSMPMRSDTVSATISRIGKAANVKVSTKGGRVKYASAHDLRRAFGERWAMRVEPAVLMMLMRHSSINTTMRYYVGRNADRFADVIWKAIPGEEYSKIET